MTGFLLDEALAMRLTVERLNAQPAPASRLPAGMRYEDVRTVPTPGPVAAGPAAAIVQERAHA